MTACELIHFYSGINVKCQEFAKEENSKLNKYFNGITQALVNIKECFKKI